MTPSSYKQSTKAAMGQPIWFFPEDEQTPKLQNNNNNNKKALQDKF